MLPKLLMSLSGTDKFTLAFPNSELISFLYSKLNHYKFQTYVKNMFKAAAILGNNNDTNIGSRFYYIGEI
jgi:hypothetical protein